MHYAKLITYYMIELSNLKKEVTLRNRWLTEQDQSLF